MSRLSKEELVAILENIARLLELKGENPFKVRAYTQGARTLETTNEDLAALAAEDRLSELPGIGAALAKKLAECITTGRMTYYEELRDEFPASLFDLFELQGLGAKKIKVLYEDLGIDSLAALREACEAGRIANLSGFGAKTEANLLKALAHQQQVSGYFLYGNVIGEAEALLEYLRDHPAAGRVEAAGSLRRRKEIVHDLDFLASSSKPGDLMEYFTGYPGAADVLAHGETKSSLRLKNGIQCDLRVVKKNEFPFALAYFTGSKEHNVALRQRALRKGWTLNEYRFAQAEGKKAGEPLPEKIEDEAGLYQALGLDFVPPELRENTGEIEAAAEQRLPKLVEWENLRGALHNHTNASDGAASVEEMAAAARELGLEYLGIADHSKGQVQANGLSAQRLAEQVDRIRELNKTWDDFRLFAGVECDILKDGRLDFEDEVLAPLDYVVASVHGSFSLSEVEMTKRIIRAMENPLVTILGHPTGRLLLSRDGYRVDLRAVIEAAADLGVVIELNANPHRLDLDWRWWPLAREKGVRCAINPDAHRPQGLKDLWIGTGIARKGWLTRKDIVNCLPVLEMEPFLKARRK